MLRQTAARALRALNLQGIAIDLSPNLRRVSCGPSRGEAKRRTQGARFVRWALAVPAFAVLLAACGISPTATHTITGTSTQGTVSDLLRDDNLYYTTGASCTGAFGGCKTDWYGIFDIEGVYVSDLRVKYIGKNAGAGLQFISVWNWRTMSWTGVDAFRVVAGDEVTVEKALPAGSDYLDAKGRGFVRVTTVGNMTSSSADVLLGCTGDCATPSYPVP